MDTILGRQAEAAAKRVDAAKVGFDPMTILTILTQVVPLLVSCFNRNDEPNPSLASVNFKRYHSAHPEQCRRRTARRIRAEADEPMTRDQSFALADAVIEQALSIEPEVAAECCVCAGR